jgi:hypothetical protein
LCFGLRSRHGFGNGFFQCMFHRNGWLGLGFKGSWTASLQRMRMWSMLWWLKPLKYSHLKFLTTQNYTQTKHLAISQQYSFIQDDNED